MSVSVQPVVQAEASMESPVELPSLRGSPSQCSASHFTSEAEAAIEAQASDIDVTPAPQVRSCRTCRRRDHIRVVTRSQRWSFKMLATLDSSVANKCWIRGANDMPAFFYQHQAHFAKQFYVDVLLPL